MNRVWIVTVTSYYDEENPDNGSTSVDRVFVKEQDAIDYVAERQKSAWREYDIVDICVN